MGACVLNESSNSSLAMPRVGGIECVSQKLGVYLPYLVFSFIGIVAGFLGNMLIMGTILYNKTLRANPTFVVIFNMALSDIWVNVASMPFTVVGVLVGSDFFYANPSLCQLPGSVDVVCSVTSLISMGILALNRYLCILHPSLYRKTFTMKRTIGICVFAWTSGLVMNVSNFIPGFSEIIFDTKNFSCLFDRKKKAFIIVLCVFGVVVPCITMLISYSHIFIYSYSSKQRLAETRSGNNKLKADSLRLAKSLFASFVLFMICWIPSITKLMMDTDDLMSEEMNMALFMIPMLHSAFNPILYAAFNPKIKENYKRFVCFVSCGILYPTKVEKSASYPSKPASNLI